MTLVHASAGAVDPRASAIASRRTQAEERTIPSRPGESALPPIPPIPPIDSEYSRWLPPNAKTDERPRLPRPNVETADRATMAELGGDATERRHARAARAFTAINGTEVGAPTCHPPGAPVLGCPWDGRNNPSLEPGGAEPVAPGERSPTGPPI